MAPTEPRQILVGDTFLTSLFDAAEKLGMRAVGIDMGAGECSLEQDHASKFMLPYTGRWVRNLLCRAVLSLAS